MTDTMTADFQTTWQNREPRQRSSTAVQILSIILFTGFAIPVSIVAIEAFWPAGIVLAGFFAYQWGRIPNLGGGETTIVETVESLRPHVGENESSTGNASFDAYRSELLERLEKEQQDFEGFLTRLRDAKDKHEFDRFMDDRAAQQPQQDHD